MRVVVVEGWSERVEEEEIMGRCGEAVECGEALDETLGKAYRGDFRPLTRAWGGEGEWLGQIEMPADGGNDKPVFLRTCAWLDASTHLGMVGMDVQRRLAG
eukprot:3932566-Rhodomonas_salina.1